MTRAELNRAVLEWQTTQDDDAVALVLEQLEPVILKLLATLWTIDPADIRSTCAYEVYRAMVTYKPGKATFFTWAYGNMRRRCFTLLNRHKTRKRTNSKGVMAQHCSVSLQQDLAFEDMSLESVIYDPTDPLPGEVLADYDQSAYDASAVIAQLSLTPLELEVGQLLADGWAYDAIAAKLQCSHKVVDNTVSRIRRKGQRWLATGKPLRSRSASRVKYRLP